MNSYTGIGFSGQGLPDTPEEMLRKEMAGSYRAAGLAGAGSNTPSGRGTPAGGPAKTYNVTFNGQTVRTASDADAQALMGMLRQAKGST